MDVIGDIRKTYEVWCGICVNWEPLGSGATSLRAAKGIAKELKWHHTKKHGWVCPKCWKRLEGEES